jgi:hypothetical protein
MQGDDFTVVVSDQDQVYWKLLIHATDTKSSQLQDMENNAAEKTFSIGIVIDL